MSTYSATLDLNNIEKIQIYQNTAKYKESSISTILSKTGGDLIFNGTIFSWNTFKPLMPIKVDGKILYNPNWSTYGMAWNTSSDYKMEVVGNGKSSKENYISCVHLVVNGQKIPKPNYQKDMGGYRPRTAIGEKNGRFAYYVTSNGVSPEGLRDLLYNSGWTSAIMLDGGGSSCFYDKQGHKIICDSNRIVQNYIIIHFKKESKQPINDSNPYPVPTITLRKGSRGEGVKWLQYQLKSKGYDCGSVDGIFGNGTRSAVMLFQRSKGLDVDRIVGKMTREALVN